MKRFLLDTGPAADFVNRRHGIYDRVRRELESGNRVGICTPVLGELWAGVYHSATRDQNIDRLVRRLTGLIIWPYDESAAREFGMLFSELRSRGRPMQQVDIQIAAIAMTLGNCTVITKDSDFAAIARLPIDNWTA